MERKKYTFLQSEIESLDHVLDQIKQEGYQPKRVINKPVYKEELVKGEKKVTPVDKEITIEVRKSETKGQ